VTDAMFGKRIVVWCIFVVAIPSVSAGLRLDLVHNASLASDAQSFALCYALLETWAGNAER